MNVTGIDYLHFTWNPYTGCLNWQQGICGGGGRDFNCWAKGLAEGRLARFYPRGFEPTFHLGRFTEPIHRKKPARIGVCFMGDLFGDWESAYCPDSSDRVPMDSIREGILNIVKGCPQHIFIFLTKCPWNLPRWNPWPDNAWVGTTVIADGPMTTAVTNLTNVQAKVRWLSIEPLLGAITMRSHQIKGIVDWIVIGTATKPYRPPRLEWIEEIEAAAAKADVPIFEKDNLAKLLKRPLRRNNALAM